MNNNILTRFIRALKVIYWCISAYYTRKKAMEWASRYILKLEKQFEGKLNQDVVGRTIDGFSAILVLLITPFTQLRNRKPNTDEKERIFLFSLIQYIYDDFTDKNKLSKEDLFRISFNPNEYQPTTIEEKIFLHGHILLNSYVKNKEFYQIVTQQIFDAQTESKKQANPLISDDDIKRISINKSGPSALICHFYLDQLASPIELDCWRQLGIITQFTDDLLDIYENIQEGINTLPTRMKDAHQFNAFFMNLVNPLQKSVWELPFPQKNKEYLINSILGIASISHLILQQ